MLKTSRGGMDVARKRQLETVVSFPANDWRARLLRGKMRANGEPGPIKANHENIMMALRWAPEWAGVLSLNEFSLDVEAVNPTPWGYTGPWSDVQDVRAAAWMQAQGIDAGLDRVGQSIQAIAAESGFHPVRQYLDALKWDGTSRIDQWLPLYLGTENTDYTRAVGSRWLISAVARIYSPGAKADCCLILEGPQGSKKSTALKTLAQPWFTDEIADLGSKDAALQTRGVWLIEIAELDSMSRGEVGKIKAFMSRTTDRFRPPYGKRVVESPRQCIFAGSVNHSTYLRDETGGRRFWPVTCSRILIDDLARDRDQLWAEAVHQYRAGAPWWLDTRELNSAAEQEQSERYEGDPWDSLIAPWIEGRPDVSVAEVLCGAIDKPNGQWTQSDQNRVSRVLTALGWEKYQKRTGEMRERRWRPKESHG